MAERLTGTELVQEYFEQPDVPNGVTYFGGLGVEPLWVEPKDKGSGDVFFHKVVAVGTESVVIAHIVNRPGSDYKWLEYTVHDQRTLAVRQTVAVELDSIVRDDYHTMVDFERAVLDERNRRLLYLTREYERFICVEHFDDPKNAVVRFDVPFIVREADRMLNVEYDRRTSMIVILWWSGYGIDYGLSTFSALDGSKRETVGLLQYFHHLLEIPSEEDEESNRIGRLYLRRDPKTNELWFVVVAPPSKHQINMLPCDLSPQGIVEKDMLVVATPKRIELPDFFRDRYNIGSKIEVLLLPDDEFVVEFRGFEEPEHYTTQLCYVTPEAPGKRRRINVRSVETRRSLMYSSNAQMVFYLQQADGVLLLGTKGRMYVAPLRFLQSRVWRPETHGAQDRPTKRSVYGFLLAMSGNDKKLSLPPEMVFEIFELL